MKGKFFIALTLLVGLAINSATAQSKRGNDRGRDRDRIADGRRGDFKKNDAYRFDRSPRYYGKHRGPKRFHDYGHLNPRYKRHYYYDQRRTHHYRKYYRVW